MAKITYSPLRLQENEDGSISYVSDLLLVGDEFSDDDTIQFANGTTADLIVNERNWNQATLVFNANELKNAISIALPDYAFASGEQPNGVNVTLSTSGINVPTDPTDPTAPTNPTGTVDVKIDTVAADDVIDAQERADGVTITGTAAANAEVVLTFKVAVVPDVDVTALQTELTAAEEALAQAQADAEKALTDAKDETLNGVSDAQDALTSAEKDLAALPKDADLKAAVTQAQADLEQAKKDAADAVVQVTSDNETAIADAQAAVDTAQSDLDAANNAETTYEEVSTATVTADGNGVWSYTLTDGEYAKSGEVIISAVATDANGNESTTETTITIEQDTTAPIVEFTSFDEKTGVVTGTIDDATATITLAIGDNEREVTVAGDVWTYTLVADDYQAAEFVSGETEGLLNLTAKAVDMAGNIGTADDSLAVPDKVAPDAPEFTSDPEAAIVAKVTTLYGSAEPNSKVVLTFGEGGITRTVYADETGQWQRPVSKLDLLYLEDDDTQVITAVSYDAAGNKSALTTFNPVPDVIALAPTVTLKNDTGVDTLDAVTKDATLLVTDAEAGATIQFSTPNGAGAPTTWSTTQPAAVQGENTVLVRQIDAHGNVSDATEFNFTFDNQVAKLDINVVGNSAVGTTLNIAAAQNVVNFNAEPETGAVVEYSVNGKDWSETEPTHTLGLNEGFVRQTDVAGNVSESAKYSFTATQGARAVSIDVTTAAANTAASAYDANGTVANLNDNVAFNVHAGSFDYFIKNFTAGDKLNFFKDAAVSISPDADNTDGIQVLTASDSATGAIVTLTLSGLTAAQDAGIFNVPSLIAALGANSFSNDGSFTAPSAPVVVEKPTTPPVVNAPGASVTINATTGTTVATAGVDTYTIVSGSYSATIDKFASGDVLKFFPAASISVSPDADNTDGVQVLIAADVATGSTTTITLTGLTAAQDAGLFNVNSINTVFGAGTVA